MSEDHVYAERMFPAPVDLGIAQPDRAVSSVTHGTEAWLTGRGGEGVHWYEGGGSATRPGRPGHHDLPADRRRADPGRPVRAGEDRHPHRHGPQPAPGRLDRPHDPRHRGRPQRGRLLAGAHPARHRRRPRPAPRELPQGHRRLPLAGRPGVRGRAGADDLRQLPGAAGHRQRAGRPLHRVDRGPQVRLRVLLHGGQRRHPHRGRHVRAVAGVQGHHQGRLVLGAGVVGPRLRRLLPRHRRLAGPDRGARGQARAQPQGPAATTWP